MGYSNYKKIKTVIRKFGLNAEFGALFPAFIEKVAPSSWLAETLEMAKLMPLTNEKSKAERLVSPILLEIVKAYATQITLFSGEDISARPEDDLSGECDFFFALHPPKPYIETPIISLVEAKNEDMEWGIAQCAAQMYGAKIFNEMEGKEIAVIYGCTTTGTDWQFMKLENNIYYIDNQVVTDIPAVLGTWHYILQFYVTP